jgi:hypothetical protein
VGAGEVALVPLALRAHVDELGALSGGELVVEGRRVDLPDLGAQLGQEFAIAGHDFPKYSDDLRPSVQALAKVAR